MIAQEYDVAVIGGGLVGSAIAYGLSLNEARIAVLDEGDTALRPSRGNFALVWVQSKGLGMPEYAGWTVQGASLWPELAARLRDETGIDVHLRQPGGFHLALSEGELERRAAILKRLHNQPLVRRYNYDILDHTQTKAMLPDIGPEVAGGSYCPLDGHVNSLKLFRALHTALHKSGATYLPNHPAQSITWANGEFRLTTAGGEMRAAKIVLAAGQGNRKLGQMVGLHVPVRTQRGQIAITERTQPFLHYPVSTVRQTDEGTIMLGDSVEESKDDPAVRPEVVSVIAERATRMFPRIGSLNVVRTWTAFRVMTEDGFPIYEQSQSCPGAFVATCHSGVTLAANHALVLARHIAAGELPKDTFDVFGAKRFHVPAAA